MVLNKKLAVVLLAVLVSLLLIAGVFYFISQKNQKELAGLNKNLPEGVKVVKTILGDYKIVNQKDGYWFKIPKDWKGVEEIEYIPESDEEKYIAKSINLKGNNSEARFVAIDKFFNLEIKELLNETIKPIFYDYGFEGVFVDEAVGEIKAIKTQENKHLSGMYVYFFNKGDVIYSIVNGSEDFIKYIILNGSW